MSREPYCTVVGFRFDHEDTYCPECANKLDVHKKRLRPIFDKSEFDSQPVCEDDDCGVEIPATVVE